MSRAATIIGFAVVIASGCHVGTGSRTSSDVETRGASTTGTTGATTTAEPPASTAPPPASTEETCPVSCFVASGGRSLAVSAEEETRLRSALGPVFARMRTCSELRGFGTGQQTPTLNLRIAPDGTLAQLGVDPDHGWRQDCLEAVARTSQPPISLPGRMVVRCSERCP